MHRAYSFPVTVERGRTKERLEASLAGLCELELRKQRQECLVLGALSLGEPLDQDRSRPGDLACFSSWGQENLTLRRQLSALQSSPWGLMQALEQQVGELRVDAADGCCDGAQTDGGDSRPSSGFYESSEGHSPRGQSGPPESTETVSSWTWTWSSDRPKSVGDSVLLNGDADVAALHASLPRSFSAPYPPLQDIAEETAAVERWQDGFSGAPQDWPPTEEQVTEEEYQQALRVESYILRLIQRHVLPPRPCQPRTTLSPEPPYCSAPGHSSLHRRTSSLTAEQRLPDPHLQAHVDLSDPKSHGWSSDPPEREDCGGEGPSLEEDCYLALPYPQSRPHSLVGRLPSPLPSHDPNALDLCCEPASPHHYLPPHPPSHHKHNFVNAQFIPGQACVGHVCSPRIHHPAAPSPDRLTSGQTKAKTSRKGSSERQRSKKSSSKTNRSQSENSLLTQRVLPQRRYSTTERHQGRHNHGHVPGPQGGNTGHGVCQRWCSTQELSQDEGEAQRRPARRARHGHLQSQAQNYQQREPQNTEHWPTDHQERAPLCQGEEAYGGAAPAESESSMSEVYSPASSSLSSDSDESGGLVWPQQLPPRLASVSSSPSSQAAGNAPSQTKAFVKIKASHALKKKILRFRSGSLKVMTTV